MVIIIYFYIIIFIDYSVGFGGKFGIQNDRVDKSAVGWGHHEAVEKHSSQVDGSKGFGGKFGVEQDRRDKSAHSWKAVPDEEESGATPSRAEVVKGDAKSLRARFENMAQQDESESKKKLDSERQKRLEREKGEKEAAKLAEADRQAKLKEDESLEMGKNDAEERQAQSSSDEEEDSPVKSPHFNKIGVSVFPVLEKSPSPPKVPLSPVEANIPVEPPTQSDPPVGDQVQEEEEAVEDAWKEEPEPQSSQVPENAPEGVSSAQGLTAIALYDYVESEADEISFDPDEIITNIEMIDEGWWRGQCRGKVGLFPANYVKLNS